jgi:hypothetical protein
VANYLLVYHGWLDARDAGSTGREHGGVGTWMSGLGEALVDGGNPTSMAKTINADGSVSDGGGKNPATGYSILKADSLERLVDLPGDQVRRFSRGRGDLRRDVNCAPAGPLTRRLTHSGVRPL